MHTFLLQGTWSAIIPVRLVSHMKKEEVIKGAQRLVCSADTPDQDDLVSQQSMWGRGAFKLACSADAPRKSSSFIGLIQARMCSVGIRRAGSRIPEQAKVSGALTWEVNPIWCRFSSTQICSSHQPRSKVQSFRSGISSASIFPPFTRE